MTNPGLARALAEGPGWPDAGPAPGPLSGVRVLDLSRVLAGPYCCTVLADLGADVVKVERPVVGDDTRHWGPPFHGDDAAYFLSVDRDRRSVALDLGHPAGRAVVRRLAEAADVVVENFLPRHLASLGLRELRDEASAVWISVRGAGGDGPDGDKPGYDVMAQARSGLMSVTGTSEPALTRALADVFRTRTAQEWADLLATVDVPCAPVQDLGALPDDPQVRATGQLQTVPHPAGPVRLVGSPYRLDGQRPRVRRAPPLLGQHTVEVLSALGLTDTQVEEVVGAHGR